MPSWSDLLFSFRGRIPRDIYVRRCLFAALFIYFLVGVSCFVWIRAFDAGISWAAWLAGAAILALLIAVAWLLLATSIKRLHDRGYSGWLILVGMIPIVSLWITVETV